LAITFQFFALMVNDRSFSTSQHSSGSPATSGFTQAAAQSPVHSDALLRGRKTVHIAHNGMLYTLQATKQGKLILTK
jgi:hemin uptake protein HemP